MSTSTVANTRGRKVRALLAGGLVLGVGAAVTLAAWTDQEWAIGQFGAGSFNVQGSADGTTFADHVTSGGAAALTFDLATDADNMSPSTVVAAPFVLRLNGETSYDATVLLSDAAATGDIAPNLTYGIVQVAGAADCTPEAVGVEVVAPGTAVGTSPAITPLALTAGAGAEVGSELALCFQITAGDSLGQGQAGTASWEFTATSNE